MYTGEKYKTDIAKIYTCSRCQLSRFRTNIVVYRGNPRTDVMVVGEGPGEQEDLQGKPMVGPTGSYLVRLLDKYGLTLYDYYITNVVLCRVPENSDPQQEHITACYDNLMMQINMIKPKYIIAVGKYAAMTLIPTFTKEMKITHIEGQPFTPPFLGGTVVIPIPHPSYIMRSRGLEKHYESIISKIVEQIKKEEAF